MEKILIIDDDVDTCTLLSAYLQRKGYETDTAYSGNRGIEKVKARHFDVIICDFRLGDKEGYEMLKEIKGIDANAKVIIITGYSDIKTAVQVIKQGAFDYIAKPLIPDEVLSVVKNVLSHQFPPEKTQGEHRAVKGEAKTADPVTGFLTGEDPATKELYRQLKLVAPTNYCVILYGESGTGKEVMAKTIHGYSERSERPFVALDCGTLSKELAGSELFGHVKGAFTGALGDKMGHFEMANGGTLFLDEVANLSYDIQASLLRVIQERKFKRIGGTKEMDLDIRLVVASNEDLQDAYRAGRFREDLFHRFNEFSIVLPPLRERKEDIPLFAYYFLEKVNEELNKHIIGFEDDVMEAFLNYSWPGNIREMKNVIRRAALLTPSDKIGKKFLPWTDTSGLALNHSSFVNYTPPAPAPPEQFPGKDQDVDLKNAAYQAEYEAIMAVLKQVNYNKSKAAAILKIDRKTLYNKLKNFEGLNT